MKEAAKRPGGTNLNLDRKGYAIHWMTRRGMTWSEFDPLIENELGKSPPPKMILIQLGSNDVVSIKGKELIETIRCSLLRFALLSPLTTIIWSEILPRGYWHGACSYAKVERKRKRINYAIKKHLFESGGKVLCHPTIQSAQSALYRPDGTHLSTTGIGILLNNYQGGLEYFSDSNTNTSATFPIPSNQD